MLHLCVLFYRLHQSPFVERYAIAKGVQVYAGVRREPGGRDEEAARKTSEEKEGGRIDRAREKENSSVGESHESLSGR